jgi:hypothetical protein
MVTYVLTLDERWQPEVVRIVHIEKRPGGTTWASGETVRAANPAHGGIPQGADPEVWQRFTRNLATS